MKLRVLLAESDTEDVLFLRDVLEEMEGSEYWSGWLHLDIYDAPTWSFAETLLHTEPTDVILLSLNLEDLQGPEAFRRAQASAPQVPVVLLIDESDVETAERLIREGAQDFLIKKHVDCEPMAHALRNAVERHRLLSAARAAAMTDSLTGLLNRTAFQLLADRDRRIAERTGSRMAVLVIEPRNLAGLTNVFGDQHRDLALVETADKLRAMAGPLDAVARLTNGRFAVSVVETRGEPLETLCDRYRNGASASGLQIGVALFQGERPASLDSLIDQAEAQLIPVTRFAHPKTAHTASAQSA
jgi:diguanylate cyclase (GGDEF)-like protein